MTTTTAPFALTAAAVFSRLDILSLPTADEDDRYITTLARHPDMHCLRFSLYVDAVIADNEAADALRFDAETE